MKKTDLLDVSRKEIYKRRLEAEKNTSEAIDKYIACNKTSFVSRLSNIGLGTMLSAAAFTVSGVIPGLNGMYTSMASLLQEAAPYVVGLTTVGVGLIGNHIATKKYRDERKKLGKARTSYKKRSQEILASIEYELAHNRSEILRTSMEEIDEEHNFLSQMEKNYNTDISIKDQTVDEARAELAKLQEDKAKQLDEIDEEAIREVLHDKIGDSRSHIILKGLMGIVFGLGGMCVALGIPAISTISIEAFKGLYTTYTGSIALLSTCGLGLLAGVGLALREDINNVRIFKRINKTLKKPLPKRVWDSNKEKCNICERRRQLFVSLADLEYEIEDQKRIVAYLEEEARKKAKEEQKAREKANNRKMSINLAKAIVSEVTQSPVECLTEYYIDAQEASGPELKRTQQ